MMRGYERIGVWALLLLLLGTLDVEAQRKRVALVLSGGGAKGVAHIGVLRVLEQVGMPVDMIVGTSMGSIVGGLYAIGYDARLLDSIVRAQDWTFLLSDKVYRHDLPFSEREQESKYLVTLPFGRRGQVRRPVGFVRGQNVYNLFSDLTIGYHDSLDFQAFSIPFACVAADMMTRREVVLDRGNLALAMRASMAIPGIFTPVSLDSLILVDGGVLNNFPVDVARAMGADVVIGVDVQAELLGADKLTSLSSVIPQLINLLCMNKYEANLRHTDLLIRPNLSEFTAASFTSTAIDTMLLRGREAALKQLPALLALKERLSAPPSRACRGELPGLRDSLPIRRIQVQGLSPREERHVLRQIALRENEVISLAELRHVISMLYGTKSFSAVNYRLRGAASYDLELQLTKNPVSSVNVGFRFDSDEMATLLFNTTLNYKGLSGSRVSLTGRLSQNPYLRVDYSLGNAFVEGLALAYQFGYNDINIYERARKKNSLTYSHHLAELGISNLRLQDFKLQVGLRYEFFDHHSLLARTDGPTPSVRSGGFFSYYGMARLETIDRLYFPTRGLSLRVDYALYTDNLATYRGDAPFSALGVGGLGVIPLSRRFSLLPSVQGRILVGHNIPYAYRNALGGAWPGRYFSQQLAFPGIRHVEWFDNSLLVWSLKLRQRVGARHYLQAEGAYAQQDAHFFDLWGRRGIWGGSVGYSRDSRLGPVDLTFSLSDWSDRLECYFNFGYYF